MLTSFIKAFKEETSHPLRKGCLLSPENKGKVSAKQNASAPSLPFISIIIPTRNEERYIRRCLESLTRQTYPNERFEVLVIDGMSKDRTLEVVRSFKGRMNLRVLKNEKIKHVHAFNLGIRESRGDYFIILSGHSFVEKDFIEKEVETLLKAREKNPRVVAVGGRVEAIHGGLISKIVASMMLSPFSGGSSFWRSTNPHFAKTVPYALYDKAIVEEVGHFDEDMIKGNDLELSLRLVKKGFKLYYNPEILSYYYTRNSFSKFVSQTLDNGAARGLCVRKGYFHPAWFVPSLFVSYQALIPAILVRGLDIALLIPLLVYWAVNFLMSLWLYKKVGKLALILPAMFWLMHNLIGIGFLKGLILGRRAFSEGKV